MEVKASYHLSLPLFLFAAVDNMAQASGYIKCWQNKQKVRECSETVPPEYAQQRIEVINDQGIIIKIIQPRKSKAQLAQEAREAKKQAAREEQRRQDMILLKSYTTEKDLLLSRDKKLTTIEGSIGITMGNLRLLNSSLELLQNQAANHERSGKKIPPHIVNDMNSVKAQIAKSQKHLAETEKKKAVILQQYADDLKRYRKLKEARSH